MEEITIKQINKEVKQLEKNFSRVVAINQQANEEIQQLKTQVEYLVRVNKEVVFLMRDSMFSSTNKEDYRKAMDTKQLAEYTNMDEQTVIRICKELKSPAYKMARYGYKRKDIQDVLECSEKTARNKINGITDFTYKEAEKIRNKLFPNLKLEYLFSDDEPQKTA